jgi:hypothetical protein
METQKQKRPLAAFVLFGAAKAATLLRSPRLRDGLLHAITLAEFLDAASGVDDLLLAGIERMAGGADFDVQLFFAQRGAGYESVATRAGDGDFFVIGMNAGFHGNSLIG